MEDLRPMYYFHETIQFRKNQIDFKHSRLFAKIQTRVLLKAFDANSFDANSFDANSFDANSVIVIYYTIIYKHGYGGNKNN
jgi:hypothetical protein